MNIFAMSFPATNGMDFPHNVVTEGHVRYCADNGHATYDIDGVDQKTCARCGVTHNGDTSANRRNARHYAAEICDALNSGERHALGAVSTKWNGSTFVVTFQETAAGEIEIEHPLTDDVALVAQRAKDEMLTVVMLAVQAKRNGGRLNESTKNTANIARHMLGWPDTLTDADVLRFCLVQAAIAYEDSPLGFGGRVLVSYNRDSNDYTLHITPFHALKNYS